MRFILASASPRRKELLEQIGVKFNILPATGEEVITKELPGEVVMELAKQKAEEYLELYPDDKTMKKELAFLKTRVTGQNENSGAETTAEAAAVDSNAADSANTDSSEEQ